MNILTAATVLQQQINQFITIADNLSFLSNQALSIAGQDNSIAEANPQIKGLVASMDVAMVSISSQKTIVQGAIDELASLVN